MIVKCKKNNVEYETIQYTGTEENTTRCIQFIKEYRKLFISQNDGKLFVQNLILENDLAEVAPGDYILRSIMSDDCLFEVVPEELIKNSDYFIH